MSVNSSYTPKGSSVFSTVISFLLLIAVLLGIFSVLNQGEGTVTYEYTRGLQFEASNEGGIEHFVLVGIDRDEAEITIPAEYHGKPVTEIGVNAFKNNAVITRVSLHSGIKRVNAYAFAGCRNLETVEFENKSIQLDEYAFSGCTSLKSVKLPKSVTLAGTNCFSDCTQLKSVELEYGVRSIPTKTFENCTELETVFIPNTVSVIGKNAFDGCDRVVISADHLNVPENWENGWNPENRPVNWAKSYVDNQRVIYRYIEGGNASVMQCESRASSITIPDSVQGCPVTVIDANFLQTPQYLEKLVLPETITHFRTSNLESAYKLAEIHITNLAKWCEIEFTSSALASQTLLYLNGAQLPDKLVIPDGVETISSYAFSGQQFSSVTIPESVKKIGSNAFQYCDKLDSINIPEGVEELGAAAFYCCSSLETVNISKTVTKMTVPFEGCPVSNLNIHKDNPIYSVEESCIVDNTTKTLVEGFVYSRIPRDVIHIGDKAFAGCANLENMDIGENVETIGESAFANCKTLSRVSIPESVTLIGQYAFSGVSTDFRASFVVMDSWSAVSKTYNPLTETWKESSVEINSSLISQPSEAGKLLRGSYSRYEWRRG